MRARASATRCAWPPESWVGLRALEARQLDSGASRSRPLISGFLTFAPAQAERDVLEDREVGEQRVVLEDGVHVALVGRRRSRPAPRLDGPDVGSSKPPIIRRVVVLPQPRRPSRLKNSPSLDLQVDVVDGGDVPEPLDDIHESTSTARARSFALLRPVDGRPGKDFLSVCRASSSARRVAARAIGAGGGEDMGATSGGVKDAADHLGHPAAPRLRIRASQALAGAVRGRQERVDARPFRWRPTTAIRPMRRGQLDVRAASTIQAAPGLAICPPNVLRGRQKAFAGSGWQRTDIIEGIPRRGDAAGI